MSPFDFFFPSGESVSNAFGFCVCAPAKSKCSVPLRSPSTANNSLMGLILQKNSAKKGAYFTSQVISILQVKLYISPRLGALLVILFPLILKKPRPKEERVFLEPKLSLPPELG